MRKQTITLYTYDELPEKTQQKILEDFYSINVDHNWYDFTFEDAERIGLKITSFDLYHNDIEGTLTKTLDESLTAIHDNHGENCDTYKLAEDFREHYNQLQQKMSAAVTESRLIELEEEEDQLTDEYRRALLEEYLLILKQEYEYLTSTEAIEETIRINEYEFTENGELY